MTDGRLDLTWLHRTGDGRDAELLARAVAATPFPAGRGQAFVHGEAEEIRAVRRHLLAERDFELDELSCSPYWRRGMTDEAWRQIKAGWIAEIDRAGRATG